MHLRSRPQVIEVQGEGDKETVNNLELIIGTSGGLLVLRNGALCRWTNKEYVYGITRRKEGEWWLAQRKGSFINRIMFDDNMVPTDFELIADLRMTGVAEHMGFHQLDFLDDELVICDTYNNRVLGGMYTTKHLVITKMIFPVGYHRLVDPRTRNPKYKHFNSIYQVGDYIYVVAHNETSKTGNKSQLFLFNKYWRLQHIIDDVGACAHNVVVDFNQTMYVCDSWHNSLCVYVGGKMEPIFTDSRWKSFTRGLAVNDDVIVVGGSKREGAVANHKQDGLLFVLDAKTHVILATLLIPKVGQIFEVRHVGLDYGLSNTWRKHGS